LRRIDRARVRIAGRHLRGSGIEIGAGANPQPIPRRATCRHYDIRDASELAELFGQPISYEVSPVEAIADDFPDGADFLIAHHTIEHASDPIGLLARFHSYVRDGATVVISLPHYQSCADARRVLPPLEHLVLDHLLGRGDAAFESSEHVYSFLLGWVDELWLKNASQADYADFVLSEGRRNDGHDLHWHAFDSPLVSKMIVAACLLQSQGAKLLAFADETTRPRTLGGDICCVYELHHTTTDVTGFPFDAAAELAQLRTKLEAALPRLGGP